MFLSKSTFVSTFDIPNSVCDTLYVHTPRTCLSCIRHPYSLDSFCSTCKLLIFRWTECECSIVAMSRSIAAASAPLCMCNVHSSNNNEFLSSLVVSNQCDDKWRWRCLRGADVEQKTAANILFDVCALGVTLINVHSAAFHLPILTNFSLFFSRISYFIANRYESKQTKKSLKWKFLA